MTDPAAERIVISSILNYGSEAYDDVSDIVNVDSFSIQSNQIIFKCLSKIFEDGHTGKTDIPSIISAANTLALPLDKNKDELKYLSSLKDFYVEPSSARKAAAKVEKLSIGRILKAQIEQSGIELSKITGDEKISSIFGLVENPIFDLSCKLAGKGNNNYEKLGLGLREFIQNNLDNPVQQVGIPTGFKEWDMSIGGGIRPGTINMFGARMKNGKAQPLDALVYTPTGPKRMGDIRIGDQVCTPDGGTGKVTGIYPQGAIPVYKMKFTDGDSVECCGEHLWEVKGYKRKKKDVLTTHQLIEDIMARRKRSNYANKYSVWSIELTKPCFYKKKSLPIDPYLMGVLLGDASFKANNIVLTTIDNQLLQESSERLSEEYCFKQVIINGKPTISYRLKRKKKKNLENAYVTKLKKLGLMYLTSKQKFIPNVYKYADIKSRFELLQGLMDTYGTANKEDGIKGITFEYSTSSRRLAKDFKELVESLGGLCKIKKKFVFYTKNGIRTAKKFISYRCSPKFPDSSKLFKLNRKNDLIRQRKKTPRRNIKDIVYVGFKECQCISIDHPDKLYLTNKHIVTHNTFLADTMAMNISLNQNIPVLMLDTEMIKSDHQVRTAAMLSGVSIKNIETGQVSSHDREKLFKAIDRIENVPYSYQNVSGLPFEDMLSIMRRWISKEVGLDSQGHAKQCVIVYDYFKLMSSEGMSSSGLAEFQLLGFQATTFQNFMVKYRVGSLSFVQLNRDGITREDSDVISGSDRIGWICSNMTILKNQSVEEQAEQAEFNDGMIYNSKLVPLFCRHGPGLIGGDYINLYTNLGCGKMTEGPTRNNRGKTQPKSGFEIKDADNQSTTF